MGSSGSGVQRGSIPGTYTTDFLIWFLLTHLFLPGVLSWFTTLAELLKRLEASGGVEQKSEFQSSGEFQHHATCLDIC